MRRTIIALACLLALAASATATGFSKGASYAGPLVGFGKWDLVLGGQYEHAISRYVGMGAIGAFSHKSYGYDEGDASYTYIALGFQCNYHFRQIEDFDLFAGGALGYNIVSASWNSHAGFEQYHYAASGSEMFIYPMVGANFPVGRKTAIQTRVGYPYYIALGLNFKL